MHWDGYTIFSVIAGVALLVMAALDSGKLRSRLWMLLGGAAFIIYGIYVAQQTSGTFVFPVWIFIIPFVAVGKTVLTLVERSRRAGSTAPPHPQAPGTPQGPVPPPPGQFSPPAPPPPPGQFTPPAPPPAYGSWQQGPAAPQPPAGPRA